MKGLFSWYHVTLYPDAISDLSKSSQNNIKIVHFSTEGNAFILQRGTISKSCADQAGHTCRLVIRLFLARLLNICWYN